MTKRRKDPIKPMFPLKHEFVDSLTHVLQEAGMLLNVVDFVLDHPEALPKLIDQLRERRNNLRSAIYGTDAP